MSTPNSIPEAFAIAAERSPNKLMVHYEGTDLTYQQLRERVLRAAGILAGWGLRRGDRVAIHLQNSPRFIEAYLAVLTVGGVAVPINTRYQRMEIEHVITDSGACLVITDASSDDDPAAAVTIASGSLPILFLPSGTDAADTHWQSMGVAGSLSAAVEIGADELAVIGYTSGTTGRSRGAMLSHGNFLANSHAVANAWGWSQDDHLLLALPLFHTHGLAVGLHGTIIRGTSMTLLPRFDGDVVFDHLMSGSPTMFFGVPTMYTRLGDVAQRRLTTPSNLRLLVSGSAPLSPATFQAVEASFGQRILERYGMTETVMNLGNPLVGERRIGSVGVPFSGVSVRIADPISDVEVEPGATGEIQVRGPNVFAGYWRNASDTERAFATDSWFKTGDLGFVDEDGYYFIVGRAKELVITGGFNVHPREVEEVIEEIPTIREVAVLGLPDDDLGEKVVAAIVPHDAAPSWEAILEHCSERIASFKKPRDLYVLDALPRNALGKVQKHLLRTTLLAMAPLQRPCACPAQGTGDT